MTSMNNIIFNKKDFKFIEVKTSIFKFIWQFILKRKKTYLILLIVAIISSLDENVTPVLLDNVIKNLELFNQNLVKSQVIIQSIFSMIYLWIFFDVTYRISGLICTYIFPILEAEVRLFMFNEVQYYKPNFISNNIKEGFLENAVADTADGVQEIVEFIIITLVPTTLCILLNVKNIMQRNIFIGFFIGIWALIHITLSVILLNKSIKYSAQLQEAQNNLAGFIVDSLKNRNLTLQCDKQDKEHQYICENQNQEIIAHKNLLFYNEFIKFLLSALVIGLSVILFIYMAKLFINNKLLISDVVFLFLTIFSIVRQIWQIGTQLTPFVEGLGQCAKGISILDNKLKLYQNNLTKFNLSTLKNHSIEFRNVTLYEGGKLILNNISFYIKDKEKVALVGESGSGKTTILKLILGLTSEYTGDVLIGGENIKNINSINVRKLCGLLNQRHYWFNRSIRDNLLYGVENATEEELIDACKQAYVYDVIEKLDQKFDSKADMNVLSGGQIQRLCLARLLLCKNKILMCDELGNGLDVIALKYIGDFIENFQDTFIMTTHSLYYAKLFDRFFIIQNGQLIDFGTNKELIERSDLFRAMLKNF